MNNDYFKKDEYWKKHIHEELEEDIWIEEYKVFFSGDGKCLDLGCGIGQYSKILAKYGYNVTSADISEIALKKVKEFNNDVVKLDMQKKLPFTNEQFDLVFANLSIHYFSDKDTKELLLEIKRILKVNGLFIGSVNGIQGIEAIKDTAIEIEPHFYLNKQKYIRLFDIYDMQKYLSIFQVLHIEERETVRFNHKKNYIIFVAKNR